jgi:hypothetical protein
VRKRTIAVGVGAESFEEEHEEAIAIMAGSGGADFLTLAIHIVDAFGALHGAAVDFEFGRVGGEFEGGVPLLGEGLSFEEGGACAIINIAGEVGGLAGDPGVAGGA